jgi:hypothetical protein
VASILLYASSLEDIARHKVTLLTVDGEGFTHCALVDLTIYLGKDRTGPVRVNTEVHAGDDGKFEWHGSTRKVGCDLPMFAVALESVTGTEATATTNVVRPGV